MHNLIFLDDLNGADLDPDTDPWGNGRSEQPAESTGGLTVRSPSIHSARGSFGDGVGLFLGNLEEVLDFVSLGAGFSEVELDGVADFLADEESFLLFVFDDCDGDESFVVFEFTGGYDAFEEGVGCGDF